MSGAAQAAEVIDVHRDANCGCCKDWIKYLETNGFEVRDHVEVNMLPVKERLGVPPRLGSCHTGVIGGKFVEGHVPVGDPRAAAARRSGRSRRTGHASRLAGHGLRPTAPALSGDRADQSGAATGAGRLSRQPATSLKAARRQAAARGPTLGSTCLPPSGCRCRVRRGDRPNGPLAYPVKLPSKPPGQQADRTVMFGSACRQMRRAMVSDRTAATVCPAQPHRT